MKTFVKICCGVLVLGLLLSVAGLACGGQSLSANEIPGIYRAVHSVAHTLDPRDHWGWHSVRGVDDFLADTEDWADRWESEWNDSLDEWDNEWDEAWNDAWDDWDGSVSTGALPAAYYDSVKHIELQLAEGRFELRTADTSRGETPYTVDGAFFKHLRSGMEDENTWRVDARGNADDERIIIYLPADTAYREVKLTLGGASLDTGALTCDELTLGVGAGSAKLGKVHADRIDVEVGAGEVALAVDARWDDCGYRAEVGLGSIKVNGKTLLLGAGESSRKGSPMLDLEAGAGAITITTNS